MLICRGHGYAPARRTRNETQLQQVGLIDVFNCLRVFAGAGCKGIQANGTAGKLLNNGEQEITVRLVEANLVNLQRVQGRFSYIPGNDPIGFYLRVVTHALEQAIDDTRGAAGATGDFFDAVYVRRYFQDACRAPQNLFECRLVIVFHAVNGSKPVAERGSHRANARGSAYNGEGWQGDAYGPAAWVLADEDVDAEV